MHWTVNWPYRYLWNDSKNQAEILTQGKLIPSAPIVSHGYSKSLCLFVMHKCCCFSHKVVNFLKVYKIYSLSINGYISTLNVNVTNAPKNGQFSKIQSQIENFVKRNSATFVSSYYLHPCN